MYGSDTNAGLNISAGAAGFTALGVTQNIILTAVICFAIIALWTTFQATINRRRKARA